MAFKPPASSNKNNKIKNILITGYPGVGKTTTCKHLINAITDKYNRYSSFCSIQGFYSQENRKNYSRIGFDIVNINDGSTKMLARIESELPNNYHILNKKYVGKYTVDVNGFEKFACKLIKPSSSPKHKINIFVVDEIGKMELFSKQFENSVKEIINNESLIVIATVPIKHNINFVENLKKRNDSKLFTLTRNNRNLTTTYITKYLFDLIDAKEKEQENGKEKKNDDNQQCFNTKQGYYRKKI